MEMLQQLGLVLLSIIILYYGAEVSLDSSERVGKRIGLSPLVVGILLIGLGTSLPEFFVSQLAYKNGEPGMALGNIIGSNNANTFLILGISGLIVPLQLSKHDVKIQLILHLALVGVLSLVLLPDTLHPLGGITLLSFFFLFLVRTFFDLKKDEGDFPLDDQAIAKKEIFPIKDQVFLFGKLIIGFTMLYFGGELLVEAGSELGRLMGVSSYVISTTFFAFGTSFPELMTALVSCLKKKDVNLITGNIIGSNIFNVSFIMGSLGFYGIEYDRSFKVEVGCLYFGALALLLLSYLDKRFHRFSGALFLTIYIGIVAYWISG